MKSFPLHAADFYKLSHRKFMREGTTFLYANLTPRAGKYMAWADDNQQVVVLGLQHFLKDFLIGEFNEAFFNRPKAEVIAKFKRRCDTSLGPDSIPTDHIEALHDLGYLPLCIKALPEGSLVNFKVPVLTVFNTHPDFAWLVTYIESVLSDELWPVMTSATTAFQFLKVCNEYADKTVGHRLHVPFQCHDFSMRGMMGRQAAALSGIGHLASFTGTDTIQAIDLIEDYYNVDAETFFIAGSVPASEHSVTSLGIAVDGEMETLRRWISVDYPEGIVSIVSDTIDYWKVLTEYLPALEPEIRARKKNALGFAKVVVRPDSGDPVRIICGYDESELNRRPGLIAQGLVMVREDNSLITLEEADGSIVTLYRKFGGTVNAKGYKELDPCIGLIYGDSITLDRAKEIFARLERKGFASSNVVFGVGSYTYQHVTRDTLGIAVKATYAVVDGEGKELFKDPKTDSGVKKSARGLLVVGKKGDTDEYVLVDQVGVETEKSGFLREVFRDSTILVEEDWGTIRNRLQSQA
jgi:nicotinamide phosphoribosyltransferase